MNIEEQVDEIVEKHKDTTCLEVIRLEMIEIGCEFIVFWGVAGEGRPYDIQFTHKREEHRTGPYQFAEKKE